MLKATMDPHSAEILRDGKRIGFLGWHPERPPRIILAVSGGEISFGEIMECMVKLRDEGVKLPEDPVMRYAYNVFEPFPNQRFSLGQAKARAEMGWVLGEQLTPDQLNLIEKD